MTDNQRFPDFIGIGAQKAGTTWLYKNLKQHPNIWLPEIKELHYFDAREKIINYNFWIRASHTYPDVLWQKKYLKKWRYPIFRKQLKRLYFNRKIRDCFEYLDDLVNFSNNKLYTSVFSARAEQIVGEITPSYSILRQESVAYIHKLMPDLKIIFILRNPIDRAWSQFRMDLSLNQQKSFEDLIYTDFIKHFSSQDSRARGDYLKTIQTWQSHYPEKQFHICFFDQLLENPCLFIREICEFLNVSTKTDYLQKISTVSENSYGNDYKNKLPPKIKMYLAELYFPELEKLSDRFGGYTTEWLNSANKVSSTKNRRLFLLQQKCQQWFN